MEHLSAVLYPLRQRMSRPPGAARYLASTRAGRDKRSGPGVAAKFPFRDEKVCVKESIGVPSVHVMSML